MPGYVFFGKFLQHRLELVAVYRCGEGGFVSLAVADDAQWTALAALLGGADGAGLADPSLADADVRRARHDEIDAALEAALARFEAADAAERLTGVGVPAQALVNAHRVMPHPQLEHRGFYQTLHHPVTGIARYPGLPFHGLAEGLPARPPPTLGQHNREVLGGELAYREEALADWERDGVIGSVPAWMRDAKEE
jgi:crotonobetainyl-CoA:carnitine CoA-transferase CaiB-like acyl-CoA transferase